MLLLAVVAQGREGEEIVVPEAAVAVAAGLALVAVVAAASACPPRSLGALLPSRRSEGS